MGFYGSQPKTPDPKETAAAQTSTNVATALANNVLGQVNQVTPDGNFTYSQNGTYKWTDPNSGDTYELPKTTLTQTLSDMQNKIKTQEDSANLNLATLGADQSKRLNTVLNQQFDPKNLPAATDWSKIGLPQYTQYGQAPNMQSQIGNSGKTQTSIANAGNIQKSLGNTGTIQGSLGSSGKIQSSIGNTGTVQSSLGKTGDIQTQLGKSGNIQSTFGDAGDITRSYQDDFSADRQKVEDALMARLNPQLSQDRDALGAKLAAQGLQPGSEAYNRAVDEASRQSNDARYGAILNAGQEQSRLTDLARQEAEFRNNAQNQSYTQEQGRGAFANAAEQQKYNELLSRGQFANAGEQQKYAEELSRGQFRNAAEQQKYNEAVGRGTFANAAEQQKYNELLSRGQFGNSAEAQKFAETAARGQFANAAQGQQFSQNEASGNFANAAENQVYNEMLSRAGFGNTANQANYDNSYKRTAGNNQLQDSAYNAAVSKGTNVDNSRSRALTEAYAMRQQPINEIAALMQGGQVTMPQFQNVQGAQMPTVDYAGLVQQDYANKMGQYQNNQSNIGGLLGGLASFFM